jgi:membrane-associated phospholipid phosphatase
MHAQGKDTLNVRNIKDFKLEIKVDSLLLHTRSLIREFPSKDKENVSSPTFGDADLSHLILNEGKENNHIFNTPYSRLIIPASLITYAVASQFDKSYESIDYETHDEVTKNGIGRCTIDDYMQFAPAVTVYGLDLMGIKAKHDLRDRTIVMTTSHIIMGGIVLTMKSSINAERPDGSNNNSFPSGHTATAFVGAHILFKEYKDTSPWIGVAGYAIAAGTGLLRVTNKKHWLSDVSAGAGIGILSAELGYLLLPVIHKAFGIRERGKSSSLVIAPTIGLNNYGLGMAYTF